jgi:hypothetical protein
MKMTFDEWLPDFSKAFDDWARIITAPAMRKAIEAKDMAQVEMLAPSLSRNNIRDEKLAKLKEKAIKMGSELNKLTRT